MTSSKSIHELSPMDSETFNRHIETLKNEPDARQLLICLQELTHYTKPLLINLVQGLQLVSILLDITIPQIYPVASDDIKRSLIELLQSIRGIGGLLNKLRYVMNNTNTSDDSLMSLLEVLKLVFDEHLLVNLRASGTLLEVNEINKLLFRGLSLSVVNEVIVKRLLTEVETLGVFKSSDSYTSYLLRQLLNFPGMKTDHFNKYFLSLLSFNESGYLVVFDILFTKTYWQSFLGHYQSMRQFEKKRLVGLFVKYLDNRRIIGDGDRGVDGDGCKINSLFTLIDPLVHDSLLDISIVDTTLACQSRPMNCLVAMLIHLNSKDTREWIKKLLGQWGDPALVKSEPLILQEFRTHFILQLIHLQPLEVTSQLTNNPLFLTGVSNRFNSYSNPVKVMAIILSDKICELSKTDKIFLMTDLEGYEYLLSSSSYHCDVKLMEIDECWKTINGRRVDVESEVEGEIGSNNDNTITKSMANLSVNNPKSYPDSDDESTEDSDDEDDATIAQRVKVPKPIYIKELCKYLLVDSNNNPQAYDMMKLALTTGPTLIRQKAQFGVELASNAVELILVLVSLDNSFSIQGFEDLRLNNLIAILTSYPPSGVEIIQMLGTGDYSLQQRMVILSSISMAARDIRGFKDDIVTKSYKQKTFATKELPQHLHEKYLSMESLKTPNNTNSIDYEHSLVKSAHLSIQDSLMFEDSEAAKDELLGGKILRMSRKLLKQPQLQSIIPRVKDYSSVITKNFYFPLVYLWHESGGIDIGHYSSLLTGHYIKTMALLLHCSVASINHNDMIREFLIIVTDVIKTIEPSQLQVIEGIVTGLLMICDVSDEHHLLINFGNYMVTIQHWLGGIWESIIDSRVKSLCAGFLLRLGRILDKYQATMIDQMNNLY